MKREVEVGSCLRISHKIHNYQQAVSNSPLTKIEKAELQHEAVMR